MYYICSQIAADLHALSWPQSRGPFTGISKQAGWELSSFIGVCDVLRKDPRVDRCFDCSQIFKMRCRHTYFPPVDGDR